MKRTLFALACWLALAGGAFAQTGSSKTPAALATETNSLWPDNTVGSITPFNARQTLLDIIASSAPFSGTTCLASLQQYQAFANTTSSPTGTTLNFFDGSMCVPWATFNQAAHTITVKSTSIPPASASAIGGVFSITQLAHNWITYIDTTGLPHQAQPSFSDISGNLNLATQVTGNLNLATNSTAGQPYFQVERTTNQSFVSNTLTKVQFDTVLFDSGSYFDKVTNFRYTPLIAGKYWFSCTLQITGTYAANQFMNAAVEKNGAPVPGSVSSLTNAGTTAVNPIQTIGTIIAMNGSTDYVECWADSNSTSPSVLGGLNSIFQGYWLGP